MEPLSLPKTDDHSIELFRDVPFHQLIDKPLDQMNPAELDALLKTTRAARVSPAVRKTMKTSATKELTGKKKKKIEVNEDLSHLM